MTIAIRVEGLGKRFVLGETFENTLSSRIGDLLLGRGLHSRPKQEEFWALRDVDFEIAEGEAVGIIGGNGAGKSTLLKVLSRITPPTLGRASVRGRLSSLLEVGTGFHPELSGRENVYLNGAILGMRRAEVERKFDEIVAFSGVEKFIDTPVKRYSSGMYVRLAFAVAAHLESDVLIIDEVLAVGDADFQNRCLGKMNDVANQGRTVIFVSHNMAAVRKLCARALWIRAGSVAANGDTESVITQYLGGERSRHSTALDLRPGLLYLREPKEPHSSGATLLSVELLDDSGDPREAASTWEPLTMRLSFQLDRPLRAFSTDLLLSTPDGVVVLRTSPSPERGAPLALDAGRYSIDCRFDRFPLAAGEYTVSIRLSIPMVEVLSREDSVCLLEVDPVDVYESGVPPTSNRYLVATEHEWSTPFFAGSANMHGGNANLPGSLLGIDGDVTRGGAVEKQVHV